MSYVISNFRRRVAVKKDTHFKYRLVVACMVFLAAFVTSMMKVDLPFISISMLQQNLTGSLIQCGINTTWQKKINFHSSNLTRRELAFFISSYFVGSAFTVFIGDGISELLGPVWTVGSFTMLASLMTWVIPYIINLNFFTAVFSRFVVGVCAGPIVPSCYKIIVNWSPPNEIKGFLSMLIGLYLASIAIWPLLGFIITYKGWEYGFFTTGAIGFGWSFAWLIFVSNYPGESFFISQNEVKYITKTQATVEKHEVAVPYRDIFKSGAIWAYIFFELGGTWLDTGYVLTMPAYLNDIMGVSFLRNGLYSAIPPLAKLLGGVAFAKIYSKLIQRRMKPITIQKIFTIFSHYVPGILMFILSTVHCKHRWALFVVILLLGFNGASYVTSVNYLRGLSVNFPLAIFNYGILFTVTFLSIPVPLILAEIFEISGTENGWRLFMFTAAGIYSISGAVFMIKASGDRQRWDIFETD